MTARRRALFAAAHPWGSPFQLGGHHFARALVARGWDVAFVSNPISPAHLLKTSSVLRDRAALWLSGGHLDLGGHLWAYVPGALVTPFNAPLLRSGWVDRNWQRLTIPPVTRRVRQRGFGAVDLLYLDTPMQRFWLHAIDHRASVLRIADWMPGFHAFTAAMNTGLAVAAREVDAVAYTALTLKPAIDALKPRRSIHLPNGVDFERIARPTTGPPADLISIPRPIALYVGAMEAWFDFELVTSAARALPNVSFVLIGPDRLAREQLPKLPNLHLLGTRPWASLPDYLPAAGVGLIPFDRAGNPGLVDGIHPLKLYEYAAHGVPIVATRSRELELINSPAYLVDGAAEFVSAIQEALAVRPDRETLRTFARTADWSARLDVLLAELGL